MANRVCVIDMPGLNGRLAREIPADSLLGKWLAAKKIAPLTPSFPAVTCSVQATLTTGTEPARHGIIANGLPMFRFPADAQLVDASNFAEYRRGVSFWEQSNQFVEQPRFWQDAAGRSLWKTSLLFFQNSVPGFSGTLRPAADIVVTPKPEHGADGKLTSLCWSSPGGLIGKLQGKLGPFPLMNYWGPMAGIAGSKWIAEAGAMVWREEGPELQWVYVPHLDYDLQRFGPESAQANKAVKDVAAAVEPLVAAVLDSGGKLVLLSEYGIKSVSRYFQPNRILAESGLLLTRSTPDGALIDYEKSAAFAMVDHQVAHIYCKDGSAIQRAEKALDISGVERVKLRHRRAGDIVLVAPGDGWFDYRWWSDPGDAPVFAKLVDIHRKPGYDPLELFWDRAAGGVPQDPSMICGSHGAVSEGEGMLAAESARGLVRVVDVAALVRAALA